MPWQKKPQTPRSLSQLCQWNHGAWLCGVLDTLSMYDFVKPWHSYKIDFAHESWFQMSFYHLKNIVKFFSIWRNFNWGKNFWKITNYKLTLLSLTLQWQWHRRACRWHRRAFLAYKNKCDNKTIGESTSDGLRSRDKQGPKISWHCPFKNY